MDYGEVVIVSSIFPAAHSSGRSLPGKFALYSMERTWPSGDYFRALLGWQKRSRAWAQFFVATTAHTHLQRTGQLRCSCCACSPSRSSTSRVVRNLSRWSSTSQDSGPHCSSRAVIDSRECVFCGLHMTIEIITELPKTRTSFCGHSSPTCEGPGQRAHALKEPADLACMLRSEREQCGLHSKTDAGRADLPARCTCYPNRRASMLRTTCGEGGSDGLGRR